MLSKRSQCWVISKNVKKEFTFKKQKRWGLTHDITMIQKYPSPKNSLVRSGEKRKDIRRLKEREQIMLPVRSL